MKWLHVWISAKGFWVLVPNVHSPVGSLEQQNKMAAPTFSLLTCSCQCGPLWCNLRYVASGHISQRGPECVSPSQDVCEDLQPGAFFPEQPGGLPLHRLRQQLHLRPALSPALAPPPHPPGQQQCSAAARPAAHRPATQPGLLEGTRTPGTRNGAWRGGEQVVIHWTGARLVTPLCSRLL